MNTANNILTLYKIESNYPGTWTKNSGLKGDEIDKNMLFLHGEQIAEVEFEGNSKMILKRIDGTSLEAELPKIGDSQFSLDEKGNLNIKNPSGEEITVEGFFTKDSLNIASKMPLKGKGTEKDPLRIDKTYISGDLGYVEGAFIKKDDIEFEPGISAKEIRNKLETSRNRIIVKITVYPCFGTKEIHGTGYALLDGDEIRMLNNGDTFTLIGIEGETSAKYMLENAEPIEVINKIYPEDGILSLDQFGLKTDLSIERGYVDNVYSIFLKGRNGKVLSSITAGDFLMDSFLEEVRIEADPETKKTYLLFRFRVVDENQRVEYNEVKIDIDTLMADIIKNLDDKILALQSQMEEMKKELDEKIELLNKAIDCIDKSAIKEITDTDNQILVTYSNNKEGNNKTAKISFAEDTYFIAGE